MGRGCSLLMGGFGGLRSFRRVRRTGESRRGWLKETRTFFFVVVGDEVVGR